MLAESGLGRRGTGWSKGTAGQSSSRVAMECGRRWRSAAGRGVTTLCGRRGCGVYTLKAPKSSRSGLGPARVGSGAGGGGSSQRGQASASESGLRGGAGLGLPAPSVMAAGSLARAARTPPAARLPPLQRSAATQPCFPFSEACFRCVR